MITPWNNPLLNFSPAERHHLEALHLQRVKRAPVRNPRMQYHDILEQLPHLSPLSLTLENGAVAIGTRQDVDDNQFATIEKLARELMPWKKGPFKLFGIDINAEWDCDQKWQRLQSVQHLFNDKLILDIGCNNGYYLYRLAMAGAKHVLGIDPIYHVYAQWLFLQHFACHPKVEMAMWGVQDLEYLEQRFDVVLNMGIIYHHRDPIGQLSAIKRALKPGGVLVLESIGIPGEESHALCPPDRYAQMSNVWFIPTMSCLETWCHQAKFSRVERLSSTLLTSEEQRTTPWSGPVSLADFLDPNDGSKTIEGHPAPYRHLLLAYV